MLLSETDQRATVLGLIERARQNSDLHADGGHPFLLKASFQASGNVQYTGSGQLEELWYSPMQWRWSARFGSYCQNRIHYRGRLFDENPNPMPLRLQMVRSNIFWPILMMPGSALRISPGTCQGQPVMCVLGPRSFGDAAWLPTRRWEETEFCVDTKNGPAPDLLHRARHLRRLQLSGRHQVRLIPRTISVYEGSSLVLNVRLDSLADAPALDPKQFAPTPQMQPLNTPSIISGVYRFPMFGGVSPTDAHGQIQSVIVHAAITPDNSVEEVEPLQTSDPALSAAALNVVKNSHTFPWPERQYPGQREVFVNVRFVPPSAPKCSPDIPVWERCAAPRFVALPARSYFQETLRRAKLDHFPLTATKHAPI